MEQLAEIQNNQGLEVGMVINIPHQKFCAEEIGDQSTSGIQKEFRNLSGRITNIENGNIYFKWFAGDKVSYRIHIAELYKLALKDKSDSGIFELALNYINFLVETFLKTDPAKATQLIEEIKQALDPNYGTPRDSVSTRGDRATDITYFAFNHETKKLSPRMLTVKYSKTVYDALYKGNPDKQAVVAVFEDLMEEIFDCLVYSDFETELLDYLDPILFTIDKYIEDNYDSSTLEALKLIRIFVIEIGNHIEPKVENTSLEIGTHFYKIFSSPIRVKVIREDEQELREICIIDGHIIRNNGNSILLESKGEIFEIYYSELALDLGYQMISEELIETKEEVLKILKDDLEDLNPGILNARITGYLEDNDLLLDNPLYKVLVFLSRLKKEKITEVIQFLIAEKKD